MLAALFAASVCALHPGVAAAQTLTKVRFSLDWKFEGQSAPFHMAKSKKYYEQEGLDVTVDAGNGSAAAIQRIGSGAYDIAVGDLSSLMEFMGNNPGPTLMQGVYLLYEELPMAYMVLRKSGVKSIAELAGKSVASPAFAASTKLWPMFAKAARIDPASVKFQAVDPALLATLVIRGDVTAMGGFQNNLLDFTSRGIKAEDVLVLRVADIGVRAYGNAVLASTKLIADNPKAVAAFVRATNRAFKESLADPAAGVKFVKERDPLIDEQLELQRFLLTIPSMLTERTRRDGLGSINKLVLDEQVNQVSETFRLKVKPNPDVIFNSSFLPAKSERLPK